MTSLEDLEDVVGESHKTLFILCGYPYAGKSYVANKILEHTDIEVVSIDNIFTARGFDWNTNNLPNTEEWKEIFEESYEKTKIALMEGKNVLYDSTNQTIKSRDKLRETAESAGTNTYVIYIETPIEIVWKRWKKNQKNPARPQVSKELVQMTIDMFEKPLPTENVIVIEN